MKLVDYKPLFPYFGGKSSVASAVWEALGDPENYVEPFAGSAANLFLRPGGAVWLVKNGMRALTR